MRRAPAVSALAVTVLAAAAAIVVGLPASAHVCSEGAVVRPGEVAAIPIGVGAEDKAVVAVGVEIPPELQLVSIDYAPGWSLERRGRDTLFFSGGRIRPFECASFTVRGKALEASTFALPLILHYDDGSTAEFRSRTLGDLDLGQLVFADASAGGAARTPSPRQPATPAGVPVLIVGVTSLIGMVLLIRAARRPGKSAL
jgi:hypothetical protein